MNRKGRFGGDRSYQKHSPQVCEREEDIPYLFCGSKTDLLRGCYAHASLRSFVAFAGKQSHFLLQPPPFPHWLHAWVMDYLFWSWQSGCVPCALSYSSHYCSVFSSLNWEGALDSSLPRASQRPEKRWHVVHLWAGRWLHEVSWRQQELTNPTGKLGKYLVPVAALVLHAVSGASSSLRDS